LITRFAPTLELATHFVYALRHKARAVVQPTGTRRADWIFVRVIDLISPTAFCVPLPDMIQRRSYRTPGH
jgi:hypothetical protein